MASHLSGSPAEWRCHTASRQAVYTRLNGAHQAILYVRLINNPLAPIGLDGLVSGFGDRRRGRSNRPIFANHGVENSEDSFAEGLPGFMSSATSKTTAVCANPNSRLKNCRT